MKLKRREQIFLRFVESEDYAWNDLDRGYSFHGYEWFSSPQQAEDFARKEELDVNDIVPFDMEGRGKVYGIRQRGLSGFGPYDTVDEALQDAVKRGGYSGMYFPLGAAYRGRYIGKGHDIGEVYFAPSGIADFVEIDE